MFRKKDILSLAIAVLGMGLIMLWRKKPQNQPSTRDTATNTYANDSKCESDPVPEYKNWYADKTKHQKDERNYWGHQVRIAYLSMGIGVVTLAIAVAGACIAYKAFVETKRQAEAAEKNIPRAWLFVEMPTEHIPDVYCDKSIAIYNYLPFHCITKSDNHEDNTASYRAYFTFNIRNFGRTPAIIESAQAFLFINRSENPIHFPLDENEHELKGIFTTEALGFLDKIAGATVGENERFVMPHKPDTFDLPFFQVRLKLGGPTIGHVDQWIRIIIRYSDPNGIKGETGYMAKADFWQVSPVTDKRYTYEK